MSEPHTVEGIVEHVDGAHVTVRYVDGPHMRRVLAHRGEHAVSPGRQVRVELREDAARVVS